MACDLCGGGPSPSPRMWQGGPGAQFEQAGESCTRWGRAATVCMTTEDKEHKCKKNHA